MTASNCLSRLAMSALLVAFLFWSRAYAQDLTPRAYWPALNVSFIRSFKPSFWVSLDLNYYLGGRTTIGGTKSANFQRNSRVGFTIVHSIKGRHAIKGSFSNGVITESGGDYQIISISYIYAIG